MVSATIEFETQGGIRVARESFPADYHTAIDETLDRVNSQRGAVLSSNYEYPGRYTRWDTAIVNPPLGIEAQGKSVSIIAYQKRGEVFLDPIYDALKSHDHIENVERKGNAVAVRVRDGGKILSEEERSRAPTVFSVVRAIVDLFRSDADPNFGLFGAFGYDLAFQFDDLEFKMERGETQRDLVLFLPDQILVVDHHQAIAWHDSYEFSVGGISTRDIPRETIEDPFRPTDTVPPKGDHQPGEYAKLVEKAKEKFKRGDLFEVVPGQMFYEQCKTQPAEISRKLKSINPSPYSFFINLGEQEYLVGASPEMFVRVTGRRIETCPISGTIRRGRDAIEDSEQILKLLNSKKDESELTMCSDVDRNDKSRVCEPGSVKVIGRRQIEMYSKLIHTVDHIEGRLREGMDAFDGFLSHAWAVTVTGAPKLWAMRYIEENEKSPRAWYGGAVGIVITVDDVIDVITEEATEDMYHLAGLSEEDRVFTSARLSIRKRLPWMVLNLPAVFVIAAVVGLFERTLSEFVALAMFLPVVAGMGGNGGIQSLTVITRAIALGEIEFSTGLRAAGKEMAVGLVLGLTIGLLSGGITYLWRGNATLGLVLFLAMAITMAIASLLGAVIPLALKAMRQDPALGSGVLVTFFTDAFGIFAFLGTATLLLDQLT